MRGAAWALLAVALAAWPVAATPAPAPPPPPPPCANGTRWNGSGCANATASRSATATLPAPTNAPPTPAPPTPAPPIVGCALQHWLCNDTLWRCLRGVPDKCGCVNAHWLCLERNAAACRTEADAATCNVRTRGLLCPVSACPADAAFVAVGSSGWIVALVLFVVAVLVACGVCCFVGHQRGWFFAAWRQAAVASKQHGSPVKLREPPVPLASAVVIPAGDVELPEDISLSPKALDAWRDHVRHSMAEKREARGDATGDEALERGRCGRSHVG